MVADANKPERKNWKDFIPESESVLSGFKVIGDKFILTYDQDASNHAYVFGLDGKRMHEITLPSLGSVGFSGNKEDKECFFSFTSFTNPGAIYTYDVANSKYTLYRPP